MTILDCNDPQAANFDPGKTNYTFEYEPINTVPIEGVIPFHQIRVFTEKRAYEYISDHRNQDLPYTIVHFDEAKPSADLAFRAVCGTFKRVAGTPLQFEDNGPTGRIHIEFNDTASSLRILNFHGPAIAPLFQGQFALRRFHIPADRLFTNAADKALAYWIKRHPVW